MDRVAREGSNVNDVLRQFLDIEPKAVDTDIVTMHTLILRDEAAYRKFMDKVAQEGISLDDVIGKLLEQE